ncbi:dihydroxyacetone kinase subunit DhaL [Hydrogenoanaerobacterium sp.]|uniref:dihydroxyacetone kinase subunit DhaL n=1 Tax=Hydrogenoanaerobacterium sp. TaxID=2953763 RepID=UPI0028A058EA|nr:dihydroxyacetone kinase subunit DhaL [Hydrogenoanaerobacterium sp.]
MTDAKKLISVMEAIAQAVSENKELLTELDSAIGDSDHGINLDRGFQAVAGKLRTLESSDVGSILQTVGMTLISTVGGASGPLYGTAFLKAAAVAKNQPGIEAQSFIEMLGAAIDGIRYRGKSQRGEKTMLDALIPAYEALTEEYTQSKNFAAAMQKAVAAAEEGVEYTKQIIATKGRASYLGERSLGHQDPGATSATLLLQTIQNSVVGGV